MSALIGGLAMVLAALVTGVLGLVPHFGDVLRTADVPPAAAPAEQVVPVSPIGFDAFVRTMQSPDLTELQRTVFLADHLNRRVEWEGVVSNVTPAEGGDDKRYLLGLAPATDASPTAACWFAVEWGTDLLGLKPGQRVVVTGVLSSYEGTTPILRGCSLKRV